MPTEERLTNLEAKIAHQEQSILELSEEIYRQQKQLARLEQTCQTLLDQARAISESRGPANPGPEQPPHY